MRVPEGVIGKLDNALASIQRGIGREVDYHRGHYEENSAVAFFEIGEKSLGKASSWQDVPVLRDSQAELVANHIEQNTYVSGSSSISKPERRYTLASVER